MYKYVDWILKLQSDEPKNKIDIRGEVRFNIPSVIIFIKG